MEGDKILLSQRQLQKWLLTKRGGTMEDHLILPDLLWNHASVIGYKFQTKFS